MFLDEIKIAEIMPCLADQEKIRFIAHLEKDISEVFPYLNAVLKNAIYNHDGKTLTLKKEGRLISLHPGKIAAGKIINEQDARDELQKVRRSDLLGLCREALRRGSEHHEMPGDIWRPFCRQKESASESVSGLGIHCTEGLCSHRNHKKGGLKWKSEF